jgi:hypothetical protein
MDGEGVSDDPELSLRRVGCSRRSAAPIAVPMQRLATVLRDEVEGSFGDAMQGTKTPVLLEALIAQASFGGGGQSQQASKPASQQGRDAFGGGAGSFPPGQATQVQE